MDLAQSLDLQLALLLWRAWADGICEPELVIDTAKPKTHSKIRGRSLHSTTINHFLSVWSKKCKGGSDITGNQPLQSV